MFESRRIPSAMLALLAGLTLLPSAAMAQLNFEARGGAGIPAGDLADLTDVGGTAGAGIGYWVHPRVNLRLDGDVDILTAAESGGLPDLRLWHYNGGIEASLLDRSRTRWKLLTNVGAGATTIDSDEFGGTDLTRTYFALNGGLKVGYDVSDNVNFFVGGQAYLTFADEDDLRPLSTLAPELNGANIDQLWSFPVYAGIRFTLPGSQTRLSAR